MNFIYADMHIHSTCSDGSDAPSEIVALARRRGLKALVLTDHDNMEGWEVVSRAAGEAGIQTIPGVEITTSVNGVNVHVLGYGIDPQNGALRKYLARMCRTLREHTREVLERLNELGILDYPWERAKRHIQGKELVCAYDILSAMEKDGALPCEIDKKTFCQRYFGKKSPAYREIRGGSPEEAIDIIRGAGGLPIIAHPKLVGDDGLVRELLAYGAGGLEVNYPIHDAGDRARYMGMVREFGGIATGGTDWHGDYTQWDVRMGDCGVGQDAWEAITGRYGIPG